MPDSGEGADRRLADLHRLSDDLADVSLRSLSQMLQTGEMTSLQVFERTMVSVEAQSHLGAFVTIAPDSGETQAIESDRRLRAGRARVLEGLPMPIKDVEATRGLRTTNGSRAFDDWIPNEDGGAAHAAREAGANIFLKTNTTELALTEQSSNPLGIVTRNPLSFGLTSGGSSAGAAAAVAAGIVPAAHGSDGAGSVRLPAALCGIVGFKPSYGVIPRHPVSDQWGGRSHHGVLGRTVDDIRYALQGFAVVDTRDPMTFPLAMDSKPIDDSSTANHLTFAALDTWGECYVEPEIRTAILTFADRLVSLGFERHEFEATPDVGSIFERIYLPQLAYDVARLNDPQKSLLGDEIRFWVDRAAEIDFRQYMDARDQRGQLNRWCSAAFADIDFLVLPSQHVLAWPVDGDGSCNEPLHTESIGDRLQFLAVFNLLGWPAISIPLGRSEDGRAIGVQLVCRRGEDMKLLDVATILEQLLGA